MDKILDKMTHDPAILASFAVTAFTIVITFFFVRAQVRIAKNQLFANLAIIRQEWLADYMAAVQARSDEVKTIHDKMPAPPTKALFELQDLRVKAQWLFGSEIQDTLKNIEWQLGLMMNHIVAAKRAADIQDLKASEEQTKHYARTISELQDSRVQLVEWLKPYLYVGDVRRKSLLRHRLQMAIWRAQDRIRDERIKWRMKRKGLE